VLWDFQLSTVCGVVGKHKQYTALFFEYQIAPVIEDAESAFAAFTRPLLWGLDWSWFSCYEV